MGLHFILPVCTLCKYVLLQKLKINVSYLVTLLTCGTDYFHFEHLKLWWQIWKMWPY